MLMPVRNKEVTESEDLVNRNATTSVILGLGETGLSVARYLASQDETLRVADTRAQPPALSELQKTVPGVELRLGEFGRGLLEDAAQLVVSPGVALHEPVVVEARRRGIPVLGDIELFARAVDAPVIAITGSNGKSTVTSMVAAMLANAGYTVRAGGNLGTPALDLLGAEAPQFYVLELSSFQLERTESLRASVAVVLNVSEDHIDRHGHVDVYADAKRRVYINCEYAVVNRDDPRVQSMVEEPTTGFTLGEPAAGDYGVLEAGDQTWLAYGTERLMTADGLPTAGRHNVANALAALAVCEISGAPRRPLIEALRSFEGLPHRMQVVAERDAVTWVNDSKATNVGATAAALTGLERSVVLIAGGEGKGADFTPLREAAAGRLRAAILIGRDARELHETLSGLAPIEHAADLKEAVALAARYAQPGDTVLLSPACASFDMFDNFMARGTSFTRAVEEQLG